MGCLAHVVHATLPPHRTGATGFAIGTVDLLPVTLHLKPIMYVCACQTGPAGKRRTSGRLHLPAT